MYNHNHDLDFYIFLLILFCVTGALGCLIYDAYQLSKRFLNFRND